MSHTTTFKAPGWAHAVLIHDAGMLGEVRVCGWYNYPDPVKRPEDWGKVKSADFDAKIIKGHIHTSVSVSWKENPAGSTTWETLLLFHAGMAIGQARLEAAIHKTLDSFEGGGP